MFDIAPEDISRLNDIDLRELVGRLCEAELVSRGLSPAAVTWGGSQTAADGGLDVRVTLPLSLPIEEGFVPRASTGFQVKTPDMPRGKIIDEMRRKGTIRPVIQDLAEEAGAYVIVSSNGSTADSALQNRRNAMREAVGDMPNADRLRTDFYDRTRLATWVRCHPGLIAWVRERVGRALVGWQAHGPWSRAADGVDAEYLLDDKLRLHLGKHCDAPAQSVAEAIDELRDELAQPGKVVRLVGLSGVGKTRLAQALFDARVGGRPLPSSHAVYANLSDDPNPQPIGLATNLVANGTRAVLIVDNCPPDLHRRLSDLCRGRTSQVSVLTIEYDVRDDQPEGTQVVTLDTSSPELITKLVRHRYSHVSQVDARTIANASGGNARIALGLAETVSRSDSIAGLSDDELFQRLFRQRQEPNDALLLAAQACSLVYSFQGEALAGEEAELPRLAALAGQTVRETHRYVRELLRRDLVQRRGVWRAVLPHAIANRLASRALEDTPYDLINQHFVEGGTERLARSFSRRLSFLHNHPVAIAIVKRWLAPDGLLGDVTAFNDLARAMFDNIAPVMPEATLQALERAGSNHPDKATMVWRKHLSLLRSLAYDPLLFEQTAHILVRATTQSMDEGAAKEASDAFISLFTIYLSGTHASIEQRLGVIERLLRASETRARSLGLAALGEVLKATHFSSSYGFEFGARSRDYGYQPQCNADKTLWYGAALTLLERLALTEGVLKPELRELVAQNFQGLWTAGHIPDDVERLLRGFAADGFWREGWVACRKTMQYDKARLSPEAASRLSRLEADLAPSTLPEKVRGVVLGGGYGRLDLEDFEIDGDVTSATHRMNETAYKLGAAVAADNAAFVELMPDLLRLRGGTKVFAFGRGLASTALDPCATWARLVEELRQITPESRDVQVLRGFLSELWRHNKNLAQSLLDSALDQPTLLEFLPALHSAVELDERGAERLIRVLSAGHISASMCGTLAFGGTTDHLAGGALRDLLLRIGGQPDGFDVALEILSMRLVSDRAAQREHEPELLEAGRELLQGVSFPSRHQSGDYELATVAKTCLGPPDAGPIAAEVVAGLKQAVAAHKVYWSDNDELVAALIEVHPSAVLDALFSGNDRDKQDAVVGFVGMSELRGNPADAIPCEVLIAWCEEEREGRYPLAASIITFARRPEANSPLVWSEQAKALLTSAPDPQSVLATFIERFRPMAWSGSRAALMEANARLLDGVERHIPSHIMPFVADAKAQLVNEIAREWQWETKQGQEQDERFE